MLAVAPLAPVSLAPPVEVYRLAKVLEYRLAAGIRGEPSTPASPLPTLRRSALPGAPSVPGTRAPLPAELPRAAPPPIGDGGTPRAVGDGCPRGGKGEVRGDGCLSEGEPECMEGEPDESVEDLKGLRFGLRTGMGPGADGSSCDGR